MDDIDNTLLATVLGIHNGDGLQTRCWGHHNCAFFRCALCGGQGDMNGASITLFDGQQQVGDLCHDCVSAGPVAAAGRARRRAQDLREQADELDDLARDLRTLDPARWSLLAELHMEEQNVTLASPVPYHQLSKNRGLL